MVNVMDKKIRVTGIEVSVSDLEEMFRMEGVERNMLSAPNCDFMEMVRVDFGGELRYIVRMTDVVSDECIDGRNVVSKYIFFSEDRELDARNTYESGRYVSDKEERIFVGIGDFVLLEIGEEVFEIESE